MIYRTQDKHTNQCFSFDLMIYRTQDKHTNQCFSFDLMIYCTQDKHTNQCFSFDPMIYCTQDKHTNQWYDSLKALLQNKPCSELVINPFLFSERSVFITDDLLHLTTRPLLPQQYHSSLKFINYFKRTIQDLSLCVQHCSINHILQTTNNKLEMVYTKIYTYQT
jgi:hypothetical protein